MAVSASGDELVERVVQVQLGEADAGARAGRVLGQDDGELLEAQLGRGDVRAGHREEELVAAQTGDDVIGAQRGPQGGGHLTENLVAGAQPARVVDGLHAVDIQVAEHEPLAPAPAAFDLAFERGQPRAAVEHARELVASLTRGLTTFDRAAAPGDRRLVERGRRRPAHLGPHPSGLFTTQRRRPLLVGPGHTGGVIAPYRTGGGGCR